MADYNLGTARGEIKVDYDGSGPQEAVADLGHYRDASGRLRDEMGRFVSAADAVGSANDRVAASTKRATKANRDSSDSFADMAKRFAIMRGVLPTLFRAGAALVSLVPAAQAVAGAVAAIIPIAAATGAALPALAVGGAVALGVLKLALVGVGDAFKAAASGDQKKFEESLKRLSPQARDFARSFRGVLQSMRPFQQAVQDAAFQGLAPLLTEAAKAVQTLQSGAVGLSSAFNGVVRQFLLFAGSQPAIAAIGRIMAGVTALVRTATPTLTAFAQAFLDVAAQGAAFGATLGTSINSGILRLTEMLRTVDVAATFDAALPIIRQLGALFSSIGTIISSVMQALGADGAGALGVLSSLAVQLAAFLQTAEGSAGLNALGASLQAISTGAGQVFLALLRALGPILVALSPAIIAVANSISGSLVTVINSLAGPLASLAGFISDNIDVIIPLGAAFIAAKAAMAGFAIVQGVATAASIAFASAARILPPLLRAWALAQSLVAAAVTATYGPIGLIIIAVIALAAAIVWAYNKFEPFRNAVNQVGRDLMTTWNQVFALGRTIQMFFSALPAQISGAFRSMGASVSGVWNGIIAFFASIPARVGGAMNSFRSLVLSGVSAVIGFFASIPGRVGAAMAAFGALVANGVSTVANFFISLPGRIAAALSRIPFMVGFALGSAVSFFIQFPARAGAAIAGLWGALSGAFNTARANANAAVVALVNGAANLLRTMVSRAGAAVSGLWGAMSGAFRTAQSNAIAAATALVTGAINFIRQIPSRAGAAVAGLWGAISGAFASARSNAISAATALVNGFISFVSTLPGRARAAVSGVPGAIMGAFAGAGGWLVSAGAAILQGLASGIRGAMGGAIAAARNAAAQVAAGFKSALGISSPSKVMRDQVGKPITQGIAVGMLAGIRGLQQAGRTVNSEIIDAIGAMGSNRAFDVNSALSSSMGTGTRATPSSVTPVPAPAGPSVNVGPIYAPQNMSPDQVATAVAHQVVFGMNGVTGVGV